MAWYEIIIIIFFSSGLSGAVLSVFFRRFEKRIDRREEKQQREAEKREESRKKHEILLVQSTSAAIALGEATARAVQRIPEAHCNGDMHAALEYATQIKHEQKEFLTLQGVESLYD